MLVPIKKIVKNQYYSIYKLLNELSYIYYMFNHKIEYICKIKCVFC